MAQKHQRDVSTSPCPNPACGELVEPGDLFCGACGYDLTAVPVPDAGADHPTVTLGRAGGHGPEQGAPGARVSWPDAVPGQGAGAPVGAQRPGDLPGIDSRGVQLPPETGDFVLRSPSDGHRGTPAEPPRTGTPAQLPDPVAPGPVAPGSGVRTDAPVAPSAAPAPVAGPGVPPDGAVPGAAAPADPRMAGPAGAPAGGETLCVACRAGRVDTDGYCENCGHAQPRERDHVERDLGRVAAVSDRGLRHHRNEDAFAVSNGTAADGTPAVIAVVCDGVSSAARPDEASSAASVAAGESLLASLPGGTHPQQAMHEAILAAAEAVNSLVGDGSAVERESQRRQNAPACTFVGAVVTGGLLVVGWVGDSRAYWVPDDRTTQAVRLTEDDSWAAQMVAAGLMNEAEAYADERAHAITGWLGADAYELQPHTASFKPDRPGIALICTDGLWNYAEGADEIASAVPADASARPLHAAQVLVGHALDGGGHDNVTVAIVPFPLAPGGAGSAYTTP
ncbi:PP2C family serine/threonine-protein phosphatase [Streptomyces sp. NBC_01497]|uniref:PP2C family serine/threonine-protein phosphatase n=1 Tax=Streptomyces sp. NBC_01497 TaxID=2903885 RepID=UPI002E2F3F5C|nr:PP2C family serine/threonine-protein phosphatase [Streptomyces sp. NBC_01497]